MYSSLQRRLHVSVCCAAAAAAAGSDLTARIKDDMKAAMKAKDAPRLDAIRFLSAALKQREIELRESGKQVTDAEALAVIQKMSKQRRDSIEQYKAGGRDDLAGKEEVELQLLLSYLPAQLSREELGGIVAAAVAETGAASVKQMGQVMKLVTAKTAGRADGKMVSELVKAALAQK
ncbi:Yqey-like protein-domain-containing protein [Scenedesmus sp. NREL 46B-D3]|nr:Yqey-like protein-domain-containing protein [Scenedesmus sp. NREL 46B-D3]